MFMNESDINRAVERYRYHPVLGKATRFLAAFRDEVDAHSDGWAYWRAPVEAARKLMTMIKTPDTATEDTFKAALTSIRRFYTKRGIAQGMIMPLVEGDAPPPEPIPTNTEFVSHLMEFSKSGAMMQLFILIAIEKYAEQCIEAGPAVFNTPMLSGEGWIRAATEAKASIEARHEAIRQR